ncbi:MAG: hypothetical protein PHP56_04310, partial [Smithellaceae bacterium]|nr:hypothetical protein [Smithellaceae bacterium]
GAQHQAGGSQGRSANRGVSGEKFPEVSLIFQQGRGAEIFHAAAFFARSRTPAEEQVFGLWPIPISS